MSHPVSRGDRRRIRKQKIASRYQRISWIRCDICSPALCRCPANQKRLGSLAKTPVPCSCYMCGNPRRHWGAVSMAERRVDEKYSSDD